MTCGPWSMPSPTWPRNGIEWRAMPADFPPWDSVYAFYQRWNARGLPQHLVARLRGRLRERQGRKAEPTACIIDSQIVKCADTVGRATSGYHGGKKITGRRRRLIVDTEGWPLALAVTAASVSDKAGARLAAARLIGCSATLQLMWADSGYDGKPLREWMKARRHHARDSGTDQPALLPGPETPLGRRADLRLAHALPPPRPRLRAPPRPPRRNGLLGHRLHHDQTPHPVQNQAAPAALGRRAIPPHPAGGFTNRLSTSPPRPSGRLAA